MFKKFFALTILLLTFATQASAMELQIQPKKWFVSIGSDPFTLRTEGATQIEGDNSKGVVRFGENLYLHFDGELYRNFSDENFDAVMNNSSRFGGRDIKNTVPYFVFEGSTKIYPIANDAGLPMFALITETGGGGLIAVIGERGGKWVQYFDTSIDRRNFNIGLEYYLRNFYAAGDTLIFVYEHWETKKTYELRYKWDVAAQWFGVELVQ